MASTPWDGPRVSVTQPNGTPRQATGGSPRRAPGPPPISREARLVAYGIVVCLVEGAGRKWLVNNPSFFQQAFFYFAKDFFFLAAAMTALSAPARSSQVYGLKPTLNLAALMIFLAGLINATSTIPVGAVVSLRNALLMPWLALTIAPALRSQRDIDYLLKTIGYGAVGIAILGAFQFYLPTSHVLNKQVYLDQDAVTHLSRMRASGTFVFISGMCDLAMAASWAGTCLLLRHPRQTYLGGAFMVAGLTCASAAVSRSGILGALVIPVFSSLLLPSGRRDLVVLLLVFVMVGMYSTQDIGTQDEFGLASSTFVRFRMGDSVYSRTIGLFYDPWAAMQEVPVGVGLGSAQSASAMLKVRMPTTVFFESELGRIVLEIGVIGLLAVILLRFSVVAALWASSIRSSSSEQARLFAPLRMTSFVTAGLFLVGMTYVNHIGATFAWTIVLIALATCEIEARSNTPPAMLDRYS